MDQYLLSLARLRDLELKLALPAHGELIQDPTAYCQFYIDHRLQREQSILSALQQSASLNTEQLLSAVYPEIEEYVRPLALQSLESHLDKLVAENRISGSKNTTSANAAETAIHWRLNQI